MVRSSLYIPAFFNSQLWEVYLHHCSDKGLIIPSDPNVVVLPRLFKQRSLEICEPPAPPPPRKKNNSPPRIRKKTCLGGKQMDFLGIFLGNIIPVFPSPFPSNFKHGANLPSEVWQKPSLFERFKKWRSPVWVDDPDGDMWFLVPNDSLTYRYIYIYIYQCNRNTLKINICICIYTFEFKCTYSSIDGSI